MKPRTSGRKILYIYISSSFRVFHTCGQLITTAALPKSIQSNSSGYYTTARCWAPHVCVYIYIYIYIYIRQSRVSASAAAATERTIKKKVWRKEEEEEEGKTRHTSFYRRQMKYSPTFFSNWSSISRNAHPDIHFHSSLKSRCYWWATNDIENVCANADGTIVRIITTIGAKTGSTCLAHTSPYSPNINSRSAFFFLFLSLPFFCHITSPGVSSSGSQHVYKYGSLSRTICSASAYCKEGVPIRYPVWSMYH